MLREISGFQGTSWKEAVRARTQQDLVEMFGLFEDLTPERMLFAVLVDTRGERSGRRPVSIEEVSLRDVLKAHLEQYETSPDVSVYDVLANVNKTLQSAEKPWKVRQVPARSGHGYLLSQDGDILFGKLLAPGIDDNDINSEKDKTPVQQESETKKGPIPTVSVPTITIETYEGTPQEQTREVFERAGYIVTLAMTIDANFQGYDFSSISPDIKTFMLKAVSSEPKTITPNMLPTDFNSKRLSEKYANLMRDPAMTQEKLMIGLIESIRNAYRIIKEASQSKEGAHTKSALFLHRDLMRADYMKQGLVCNCFKLHPYSFKQIAGNIGEYFNMQDVVQAYLSTFPCPEPGTSIIQ